MKKQEKMRLGEILVKSFSTHLGDPAGYRGGHESGCPGCPGELTYTRLAPWCSGEPACPA